MVLGNRMILSQPHNDITGPIMSQLHNDITGTIVGEVRFDQDAVPFVNRTTTQRDRQLVEWSRKTVQIVSEPCRAQRTEVAFRRLQ
jgi:hypothetical protein